MLPIASGIALDEQEIQIDFVRASGPGGQNVNKVASAAQLRFDVDASPNLPAEVKARLRKLGGRRVTSTGVLIIEARRYRTQEANRADALQRFMSLVQKAAEKPRSRKRTQPTSASREQRLREKKKRSELKRSRGGGEME
jgi:ribosome-associated protein